MSHLDSVFMVRFHFHISGDYWYQLRKLYFYEQIVSTLKINILINIVNLYNDISHINLFKLIKLYWQIPNQLEIPKGIRFISILNL